MFILAQKRGKGAFLSGWQSNLSLKAMVRQCPNFDLNVRSTRKYLSFSMEISLVTARIMKKILKMRLTPSNNTLNIAYLINLTKKQTIPSL